MDRSNEKKLHENLDGFIAGLVSQFEFATEEDRVKAPAKIFSAFVEQKFWFRKIEDRWEQENEMNGQRYKIPVSVAPTEKANQFRIIKDGKPSFVVALDSDDKMTLTSIKDKITFPLIRQESHNAETAKPGAEQAAPSNR